MLLVPPIFLCRCFSFSAKEVLEQLGKYIFLIYVNAAFVASTISSFRSLIKVDLQEHSSNLGEVKRNQTVYVL